MQESTNHVTITKISITGFKEYLLLRQQMCGLELGFSEEIRPNGDFDHVRETPKLKLRNFFVHHDLITQFALLSQHLAIISEYKAPDLFDEDYDAGEEYDAKAVCQRVFCTSATLTGSHERAGVVLEGFKLLANGKKLKLTTPSIEFAGFSGYDLEIELSELMDQLSNEAMAAFRNEKRLILQTELDLSDKPSEGPDPSTSGTKKPARGRVKHDAYESEAE